MFKFMSVIYFLLITNPTIVNGIDFMNSDNFSNNGSLYKINRNLLELNELSRINYMVGIANVATNQFVTDMMDLNSSSITSSLSESVSSLSMESISRSSRSFPANRHQHLTQCQSELSIFLNAVRNQKVWALKLIDSYGNIPKSINWGNYYWFTSREICYDLNEPFNITLSSRYKRYRHQDVMNSTSPFPVEFRMMYFNFTTPFFVDIKLQLQYYIYVGLCIPKSCRSHEIIQYTREYFESKSFEPQQLYDIELKFVNTKIPGFSWSFLYNPGLLMFFIALVIVITCVSLAELLVRLRNRQTSEFKKVIGGGTGNIDESYSNYEKFLLCWSVRDNYKKTLSIENSKQFFPVIAGLRTIVCLWVTLFHVYYYNLYTLNNIPVVFSKLENYILQPVLQSCYYVDVFFVISAFLHVYHFLTNTNRNEVIKKNSFYANFKLFLRLVFHRYFRLMPVFFLAMVASEAMFEFLDMYSPFVMDTYSGLHCRRYWWYNVLFINNFLDLKDICSSWSWYLACEMQFFIIFLIILFIYTKSEFYGKTVFIGSVIFFTLISFYANYHYGITFQLDVVYSTLEQLYVKPWTRILPYFGGAFMGWLYYKSKSLQITLSKLFLTIYWIIVGLVYLATCEMSYWKNTPTLFVSIIMSIGKLFFGLLWGSVIYICQHGHGGLFAKIMGSKIFLFLNKFCYSIYMISPIIITALYGLRTESSQFNEVGSATDFIAILCICLPFSILIVILWEMPWTKISNKFILKKN